MSEFDEAVSRFALEVGHEGFVTHWALVVSSADSDGGDFTVHGSEGQAKHMTLGLLEAGKVLIKSEVYNAGSGEFDD